MTDAKIPSSNLAKIVKSCVDPFITKLRETDKKLAHFLEKKESKKDFDGFRKSIKSELDEIRNAAQSVAAMYKHPDLTTLVDAAIEQAISSIPKPENGKDETNVTFDEVMPN
ncbi:MAG: hypothetical protein JSC189_000627 [Candidatus Tokpelaia sp. JSC189]|nr:MAG: hypothetical protein JSC189_000627 [Candidatus Tokpelaia sp. JSC189]